MWEQAYICGAVTRSEGKRLARLAAVVPEGQVIVELGSHGGSSTSWLALGVAKAKHTTPIYAVDLWDRVPGERIPQHAARAVRRRFDAQMAFMESAGYAVSGCVHPIKASSLEAAGRWEHGAVVGLLHVDALHTYEAVAADVDAWTPHLAPGAVVVLHDWSVRRWGVRKLGTELLHRREWSEIGRHEGDRHKGKHGQLVLRYR